MKCFKHYGERPFSIGGITEKKWEELRKKQKLDCGIEKWKWLFSIQDLFFSKLIKESCEKHDIYYGRQGNWFDKIRGDWYFFKFMFWEIVKITYKILTSSKSILNIIINFISAVFVFWVLLIFTIVYFIAVFVFGFFIFKCGKYKTLKEIINEKDMNYKKVNKKITKKEDIVVVTGDERKNTAERIVIHHTVIPQKVNPQFWSIKRIHEKERGWMGVGYNFVIEADGTIMQARAVGIDTAAQPGKKFWKKGKKVNLNFKYLSISLAGNFMTEKTLPEQLNSLKWLVKTLEEIEKKNYVKTLIGHRDVDDTLCPGKNVDLKELKAFIGDKEEISINTRQTLIDKIYQIIYLLIDMIKILLGK